MKIEVLALIKEEFKVNLVAIGNTIREKRESMELSQEELATDIGIDRKHLSAIENGKQNMTLDTLFRVCSGLNISPIELFKNL